MSPIIPIRQQTTNKILVVIDTVSIQNRSLHPDLDDAIEIDDDTWFLISSEKPDCQEEESENFIALSPDKENIVSISGTSIDAGSSNAIIVSQVEYYTIKKDSLIPFKLICESKQTIENNDGNEVASVDIVDRNFIWFESRIHHHNIEEIKISFSLYNLDTSGNQQNLYGNFWFTLAITDFEN